METLFSGNLDDSNRNFSTCLSNISSSVTIILEEREGDTKGYGCVLLDEHIHYYYICNIFINRFRYI